ncbi:hypothetical protein L7F22_028419 [Adiantum nelumboides]|nr:hypothetical protein [Adiantum nelumboides]
MLPPQVATDFPQKGAYDPPHIPNSDKAQAEYEGAKVDTDCITIPANELEYWYSQLQQRMVIGLCHGIRPSLESLKAWVGQQWSNKNFKVEQGMKEEGPSDHPEKEVSTPPAANHLSTEQTEQYSKNVDLAPASPMDRSRGSKSSSEFEDEAILNTQQNNVHIQPNTKCPSVYPCSELSYGEVTWTKVSWDTCCLPKNKGGLGIINIKLVASKMSAKWILTSVNNDDFWALLLRRKTQFFCLKDYRAWSHIPLHHLLMSPVAFKPQGSKLTCDFWNAWQEVKEHWLQQAMGEAQQQFQAYGILPPPLQERDPEKSHGKPSSKKKDHAPHEELPSKEIERSESQDKSMEDVAPRRRRAKRSPTPPKWKRSVQSPHHRKSKQEEKSTRKKKKKRKRSLSSPSSSPSSSFDESSNYSSREHQRRGHQQSYVAWKRSNKLKKFKEGGKNISFLTSDGTFGATNKVLAFIQQFNVAFGDEGFTESSKL